MDPSLMQAIDMMHPMEETDETRSFQNVAVAPTAVASSDAVSSEQQQQQQQQRLWRTRDAASDLMNSRPSSATMPYSQFEDPEHLLAKLRRDKADIVRAAFDAAATSVLQALQDESESSDAPSATTVPPPPKSVFDTLQELRETSMARAVNNKATVATITTAAASQKTTAKTPKKETKPKATRKISIKSLAPTTPEAVALETRSTVSHAVLCAAASICFEELTPPPPYSSDEQLVGDAAKDIPQKQDVNMGAVLLQAQTLGKRAASLAKSAAIRSTLRYEFRRDNLKSELKNEKSNAMMKKSLKNLFAKKKDDSRFESTTADEEMPEMSFPPPPASSDAHLTPEWKTQCAPRLLQVLQQGAGHALYYDVEWATRYKRICDLFQQLPNDNKHGPHLIVTSQPEVQAFAQEFDSVQVRPSSSASSTDKLRVVSYTGSQKQRRKLRENFALAKGLAESPFHVMVVSYTVFLQDYVHLCQLPYQVALIDDGFAWMAAAQMDPNSSIGSLWESAVWNASDEHVGLAGTRPKEWDFTTQTPNIKEALIGLTARHRILTTSSMSHRHRDLVIAPVPALLRFLVPHFVDVAREELDRSKIYQDVASMEHFRKLLSRSIVVHYPTAQHDMHHLALNALKGRLPSDNRSTMLAVPEVLPEDMFVSEGKISYTRRVATLQWFQPMLHSWLLYELGKASFKPVLDAMKDSDLHGFICEEVVTASSITTAGAGGAITGPMAYRLGLRCGRKFSSETGLRQHMAGMHAPPGTWLCRTCGVDCGTTQFRTHHERSCGQPKAGDQGGGAPTVGQGVGSKTASAARPKGKTKKVPKGLPSKPQDKDPDGSFRVPGYRGVWINKAGNYFVKVNDERLAKQEDDGPGSTLLFETTEEAARKYDEVMTSRSGDKDTPELNYRPDGSRIVYKDHVPAATTGRGLDLVGGASSDVVPALSVINIKDLPKDVKPLLRDPRQTSRTGANAKRHVYAYRGVCRQSRKGHDRWQSQISFNGSNNYLGTFDSEWDAAAVYAWAHLILYGEEATKKAQMEGEEAVAAYEQEKKDIADGKIPAPPPKPEKKKPKPKKKDEAGKGDGAQKGEEKADVPGTGQDGEPTKKRKQAPKSTTSTSKRARASPKTAKGGDLEMAAMMSKAVAKAPALEHRKVFETISDEVMLTTAGSRLTASRKLRSSFMPLGLSAPTDGSLQPCEPIQSTPFDMVHAGAILMGLSSILFGWNVETFISTYSFQTGEEATAASLTLSQEYDPDGFNETFRTAMRGGTCVIGRASKITEEACRSLQIDIPLGGTIGALDCHIGGTTISCSESAATIQFCPSGGSDFQLVANNNEDLVTLNGQRITKALGSFPLFHGDIVTVGCRVFAFLVPT